MVKKILTDEEKAIKEQKRIAHEQLMEENQRIKAERLRIKQEVQEQLIRLRLINQNMSDEERKIKKKEKLKKKRKEKLLKKKREKMEEKKKELEELKNKKEEERKKKLEERLKRREQRRKEAQESFMCDEEKFFSELKPPFNGLKGKWVRHSDNMGVLKSFGIFICNTCNKLWFSAHAISIYKQACKECTEVYVYPKYMWINENNNVENNDLSTTRKRSKNPHHRTELCEACQNGECTFS